MAKKRVRVTRSPQTQTAPYHTAYNADLEQTSTYDKNNHRHRRGAFVEHAVPITQASSGTINPPPQPGDTLAFTAWRT